MMVDMIFRLFQFDSTIYAVAPQVPSAALPEENADRLIEAAAGMEPSNEIVVNSPDIHEIQEVNMETYCRMDADNLGTSKKIVY